MKSVIDNDVLFDELESVKQKCLYRCPTKRCASYKTRNKYWNLDAEEKRACIPRLIWNDGHGEWSRAWYPFKDSFSRIGEQYFFLSENCKERKHA